MKQNNKSNQTKESILSLFLCLSLIANIILGCTVLSLPTRKAYIDLQLENKHQDETISALVTTLEENEEAKNEEADQKKPEAKPQETETQKPQSPKPQTKSYIGNKSTKKYHRETCSYLPASRNQVPLPSEDFAKKRGYSPCGHCNP